MTIMLDSEVTAFAPKVGVEMACRAFAVNPRSFRHRRQCATGRLARRARREPARGAWCASGVVVGISAGAPTGFRA